MEFHIAGRTQGKTTGLMRWAQAAPEGEVRVIVTHTAAEATRLYRSTFDAEDNSTWHSWQFVSVEDLRSPLALSAIRGRIVLGIDNADLILQSLFTQQVVRVAANGHLSA